MALEDLSDRLNFDKSSTLCLSLSIFSSLNVLMMHSQELFHVEFGTAHASKFAISYCLPTPPRGSPLSCTIVQRMDFW